MTMKWYQKYFTEILVAALVIAVLVFLYALYMIIVEFMAWASQEGGLVISVAALTTIVLVVLAEQTNRSERN